MYTIPEIIERYDNINKACHYYDNTSLSPDGVTIDHLIYYDYIAYSHHPLFLTSIN